MPALAALRADLKDAGLEGANGPRRRRRRDHRARARRRDARSPTGRSPRRRRSSAATTSIDVARPRRARWRGRRRCRTSTTARSRCARSWSSQRRAGLARVPATGARASAVERGLPRRAGRGPRHADPPPRRLPARRGRRAGRLRRGGRDWPRDGVPRQPGRLDHRRPRGAGRSTACAASARCADRVERARRARAPATRRSTDGRGRRTSARSATTACA